jgi:hypothetical protein
VDLGPPLSFRSWTRILRQQCPYMTHMADIIHELTVKAQPDRVFQSFATPSGLETWWTKSQLEKFAGAARLCISRSQSAESALLPRDQVRRTCPRTYFAARRQVLETARTQGALPYRPETVFVGSTSVWERLTVMYATF